MNREELQRRIGTLSNEDLVGIVHNKIRYTEEIVTAAQIELRKRAPSKEEVSQYKREQDRLEKREEAVSGNIDEDLPVIEKLLFFFLFMRWLHRLVRRNYRMNGYVLKLRQGVYYSQWGTAFFVITAVLLLVFHMIQLRMALIIWPVSFLPVFAFDVFYNKRRTIRRLRSLAVDDN